MSFSRGLAKDFRGCAFLKRTCLGKLENITKQVLLYICRLKNIFEMMLACLCQNLIFLVYYFFLVHKKTKNKNKKRQ